MALTRRGYMTMAGDGRSEQGWQALLNRTIQWQDREKEGGRASEPGRELRAPGLCFLEHDRDVVSSEGTRGPRGVWFLPMVGHDLLLKVFRLSKK